MSQDYKSMDEYEEHLLSDEPNLVRDLIDYDSRVCEARASTSNAPTVSLPKGEARLESLQKVLRKATGAEAEKTVLVDVKKKEPKTLLGRLKTDAFQGPIALLCTCVKERIKIRVLIRSRVVLRSILRGYLVAFDKHWNLAMQDVEETYYRRKRTRILAKCKGDEKSDSHLSYPQKLSYAPVNLRKQSNIEIWTRNLNQLFVKGDEVIIVSLIR